MEWFSTDLHADFTEAEKAFLSSVNSIKELNDLFAIIQESPRPSRLTRNIIGRCILAMERINDKLPDYFTKIHSKEISDVLLGAITSQNNYVKKVYRINVLRDLGQFKDSLKNAMSESNDDSHIRLRNLIKPKIAIFGEHGYLINNFENCLFEAGARTISVQTPSDHSHYYCSVTGDCAATDFEAKFSDLSLNNHLPPIPYVYECKHHGKMTQDSTIQMGDETKMTLFATHPESITDNFGSVGNGTICAILKIKPISVNVTNHAVSEGKN